MKKIKVFVAILVTVFFIASCGKDDAPTSNTPKNEELKDDPSESRPIEISILENGISIKGGKKIEGMPPQPSGTVDFKLDSKTPMGIQKTGFDAEFTSSSNIAGAYVLVQTTSGDKAKSYFDIPVDSLKKKNFIAGRLFKSAKKINAKSLEKNEFKADFDFTENVPPGEFCYEICVYDVDGNVSAIEEECINVQAWGGNPSIVGNWVYEKYIPEQKDVFTKIQCDNGGNIDHNLLNNVICSKSYTELVLKADGSFYDFNETKCKDLNRGETEKKCSLVYEEELEDNYQYIGKWAYNAKKKHMITIEFSYEDLLDSSKNEIYSKGYLSFIRGNPSIIDGKLYIYMPKEEITFIYRKR